MFLGQKVHYYMIYIAYYTELNLQICNYAQKRCIFSENSKYAPDENIYSYFCLRRKAANFCHPVGYCGRCLYYKEAWLFCFLLFLSQLDKASIAILSVIQGEKHTACNPFYNCKWIHNLNSLIESYDT